MAIAYFVGQPVEVTIISSDPFQLDNHSARQLRVVWQITICNSDFIDNEIHIVNLQNLCVFLICLIYNLEHIFKVYSAIGVVLH